MKEKYKKLVCKKHHQSLFYIYVSTTTGRINTVCQMCEDEIISQQEIET